MAGSNNARPTSGRGAAASGARGNGLSMNECEKMIRRSLRDPKVKFLKEQLEKSGCRIGSNFIKGYTCKEASGGGYESDRGIRAAHLSGDCHYKRELLRGYVNIRGHEQECVRRRVIQSLTTNPNCSETGAKDAMEAVWNICYNDTKPFDCTP